MKNKITCLLAGAALFGATANAEIVLTDDLSAYGYIDMALTDGEGDGNTATSVAEFELGFSFTPAESKWSAVAELSFDDGDNNDSYDFETVTVSYQYSDALSFTFGNILSYQGFETFDATGLYQFSYAGVSGAPLYTAAYAVGASADYTTGDYDFGLWVGDTAEAETSIEYLVAYNGIENLTLKFIYADDPSYETTNFWASYDYNDFTFAVEYINNDFSNGDGTYSYGAAGTLFNGIDDVTESEALVFMVYKAFGNAGLTFRYTDGEATASGLTNPQGIFGTAEYEKITISPSYAFSDNVFGLLEYSEEDLEGVEETTLAAKKGVIYE
jgi:hypothetical protein